MSEYNITIHLASNLHIGSGFGFARVIDHITVKDSEKLAYIPGSTIKGKLKSVCKKIALSLPDCLYLNSDGHICQTISEDKFCRQEDFAKRCIICRMFGSPFTEGRLEFTDARLAADEAEKIKELYKITPLRVDIQNEIKDGVKISRIRRVSEPEHLFTLENVSKELSFQGTIIIKDVLDQLLDNKKIEMEKELLKYGLKSLTHLGGQKSRGLGRISLISCSELGLSAPEGENE